MNRTPLMHAVADNKSVLLKEKGNRIEIVKMLLEAGADINARDVSRKTALGYAHQDEVRALLVANGGVE